MEISYSPFATRHSLVKSTKKQELNNAHSRGRRRRHRRGFRRQIASGRLRCDVSGASETRGGISPRWPRDQKPERGRDAEKSADSAGGQTQREVRRGVVKLQGVRPRRRDQVVCACGW